VAVLGTVDRDRVLYRSGARPGDRILVTGSLGDARAGLELLLGRVRVPEPVAAPLLRAHLEPELYLEEARLAAASGMVGAAIDLSDGLSSDLGHVCRASGVGAVIDGPSLPISDALRAAAHELGREPLQIALEGGEDYRLLVTVRGPYAPELCRRIADATGRRLHDLGEIVPGDGVVLRQRDGSLTALEPSGWDHFKSSRRASEDE
jgi:thiamine-monophosphate kinase